MFFINQMDFISMVEVSIALNKWMNKFFEK